MRHPWNGLWGLIQLSVAASLLWGQSSLYVVYFQPKPDSLLPYVETYLSPKAIERRQRQGIPVDERDLPIPSAWVAELGKSGQVLGVSRWLNAALLQVQSVSGLPQASFIRCVEPFSWAPPPKKPTPTFSGAATHEIPLSEEDSPKALVSNYTQLNMLHIPDLHQRSLYGRGIRIAILDAGFPGMNQIPAFQHVFTQGRFIAGYDFVSGDSVVFDDNSHGTMVASVILAQDSASNYAGGAPEVEVILARTEDVLSETRQEEWNWARAAEWADSLGAYIIQSSLGYSTFDDPNENYTHADMNGRTAITTQAARMAAQKGLLVVSSAGNEGSSPWRYITAPADADSILAVGAVDANGQITFFSSRGPTADGRIKPDVVAMGQGVQIIRPDGAVAGSAGTSFSAPLITSLAACLWQARPDLPAQTLRKIILESADRYANPDTNYGYGLPNGALAWSRLTTLASSSPPSILRLFPNPTPENLTLLLSDTTFGWYHLTICDEMGRQVYAAPYRGLTLLTIPTATWPSGLYWVNLTHHQNPKQSFQAPFIKL
jgi:serine protease AprX